jgi:hypothetical protein
LRDVPVSSDYRAVSAPPYSSVDLAREALAAFAQRDPATQADIDRVMRALVEHDHWYVPLTYATRAWGQSTFEDTVDFPAAVPNPVLTVFTDRASARQAEQYPLGRYGGPFDGVRLFGALDPAYSALVVNPASAPEHQWYISDTGFPIAEMWADGVLVERALARRSARGIPVSDLRSHRRYLLLLTQPGNGLLMIEPSRGGGRMAVCFTAADRAEEFLACLPDPVRPQAGLRDIDGPQLFRMLRDIGAGGLVVNPGKSGQAVLSGSDLDRLTTVATTAA